MEKLVTSDFVPVNEANIMWVFIDPPGKPDLNGKPRFVASLYVKKDSPACNALQERIDDFWATNKPAKTKSPKSLGYAEVMQPDPNDPEKKIPLDPPMISFNFWTGTTFKDGNTRKIDIHNAAGHKVSLGGKKIGNGSQGAISGQMDIYDQGVAARGVTLYLSAIQLTKFVPYEADAGFAPAEEEGAFMGVEPELQEITEDSSEDAKPRL